MEIQEYQQGIWVPEDFEKRKNQFSLEVDIAVHPYMFQLKGQFATYVLRFDSYIQQSSNPLVVLEQYDKFESTAQEISNQRKGKQTYFLRTEFEHPKLLEIKFKEFAQFLLEFNPVNLNLIGGIYRPSLKKPKKRGCVGLLAHQLETKGFDVRVLNKEGLTFRTGVD